MRILPPHDPKVFAEFAEEDCPRCIWIQRLELTVLLIALVLDLLT